MLLRVLNHWQKLAQQVKQVLQSPQMENHLKSRCCILSSINNIGAAPANPYLYRATQTARSPAQQRPTLMPVGGRITGARNKHNTGPLLRLSQQAAHARAQSSCLPT